jgi:hypothetical protein
MSIQRIVEEVEKARGNHGVKTGIVDVLYVLENFEKEEFSYWYRNFDNVFDYLEDLNERLIAENPDYEYEDEDCKDWIWEWKYGDCYFSAEEYGISNDISVSCYSNEPTGYDGVIIVFSVKLNNDEFSTCAATYFDVDGDCNIELLIGDIIDETRKECYGEEEF